jgi:hypothetical protein
LGVYGGLKEAKKPEVGTGIFFFKSPLQTFLRNKQLKFSRSFFKKPILIRVNSTFQLSRERIQTSVLRIFGPNADTIIRVGTGMSLKFIPACQLPLPYNCSDMPTAADVFAAF